MKRVCPECGSVAKWEKYFDAYVCEKCYWQSSKPKVREIIMHYNAYDNKFYIYEGEDYLYDTSDIKDATKIFARYSGRARKKVLGNKGKH